MKIALRKIIAILTATMLLGVLLSISAVKVDKTKSDNLEFIGTYSLNAFAEENNRIEKTTVSVDGGSSVLDASSTIKLTSTDKIYELYITVIDLDDFIEGEKVVIGYNYNGLEYNGRSLCLTNVCYSSVTIKGNGDSVTLSTDDISLEGITYPVFVVVEVIKVENATARITIKKVNNYVFSANELERATLSSVTPWCAGSAYVSILATDEDTVLIGGSDKSIDGYHYSNCIKLGNAGDTTARSIKLDLTKPSKITVHGLSGSYGNSRSLVIFDKNGKEAVTDFLSNDGKLLGCDTVSLPSGTYYIASANGGFNIYGLIIDTYGEVGKVTYTQVEEVAPTCENYGTVAHYVGSDGKLYLKIADVFTQVEPQSLVIPATEHVVGNDGKCTYCGITILTEHTIDIISGLDSTTVVGKVSIYGDSDTIAYSDLIKKIVVPEGYVLTGIKIGDTTYTDGNVVIKSNATIYTVFVSQVQSVFFADFSGQTASQGATYGFLKLEVVGKTGFSSSYMSTVNSVFSFTVYKANTQFIYDASSNYLRRYFYIYRDGVEVGKYSSVDQTIILSEVGNYTIEFDDNEHKVLSIILE